MLTDMRKKKKPAGPAEIWGGTGEKVVVGILKKGSKERSQILRYIGKRE